MVADGVEQINVRAGIGAEVDVTAASVGAGHHRGDAHVEIGIGLGLAVHPGEAVDQAGNDELAGAVDDVRALGNREIARVPTSVMRPFCTMTMASC